MCHLVDQFLLRQILLIYILGHSYSKHFLCCKDRSPYACVFSDLALVSSSNYIAYLHGVLSHVSISLLMEILSWLTYKYVHYFAKASKVETVKLSLNHALNTMSAFQTHVRVLLSTQSDRSKLYFVLMFSCSMPSSLVCYML